MTECEEIAAAMPLANFESLDAAIYHVRQLMPDESMTVIDNVAAALYERSKATTVQPIDSCFEVFLHGYLVCALWSSNDESDASGGQPMDLNYDVDDIAADSLQRMRADALAFYTDNAADLARYVEDPSTADRVARCAGEGGPWAFAGHDLWLTRNGHGAGYWDRGLADDLGDRLSAAAKALGGCDLYIAAEEGARPMVHQS
jgi:hypothetical protein